MIDHGEHIGGAAIMPAAVACPLRTSRHHTPHTGTIPCLLVFRFVNRRTIGACNGHLKALLAKFLGALCGLLPCFEFGCDRSSPLSEEGPNNVPHSCVPCFTHTRRPASFSYGKDRKMEKLREGRTRSCRPCERLMSASRLVNVRRRWQACTQLAAERL